jgi:hypothetical protein
MRMLVLSDLHCGHYAGLTPPRYWIRPGDTNNRTRRDKFAQLQRETWKWYRKTIRKNGPYDLIVCNGDAIDGTQDKSGGTEAWSVDTEEQADAATECIELAMDEGTKLVMTYGTAYHTGQRSDEENRIAKALGAIKIGSHEWIQCRESGTVFDFKHHCGSSSVPHGRATAVSRDAMWGLLWAERGKQPRSDVLIRSHVHYYQYCGDSVAGLRMTTPALQAAGSKYGARRCSGVVDYGFLIFDTNKRGYSWRAELAHLESEVAVPIRV